MASINFLVKDRKGRELCTLKYISDQITLGELMKQIVKESEYLSK